MADAAARIEPRVPLNRERVIRTAVAFADRRGIGALTMRALAQELGVEAMTLYYHVANKDDILSGMVDAVVDEMELPPAGRDWRSALRLMAISAYDVLTAHPWAASLMLEPDRVSQSRLVHMDAMLGTFRGAGFSPELTDHAYHALESHIMGFTLWEVGMRLGTADEVRAMAADFLRDLPRDELPHLAEHVEQHLRPRPAGDEGEFAFGLDLLLDGLDRLRADEA